MFYVASGKLPTRKIAPVRLKIWFRISVRIRAGGQFSSGEIFLEPFYAQILFTLRYSLQNGKTRQNGKMYPSPENLYYRL